MFAYCINNPVNYEDSNGKFALTLSLGATLAAAALKAATVAIATVVATVITVKIVNTAMDRVNNVNSNYSVPKSKDYGINKSSTSTGKGKPGSVSTSRSKQKIVRPTGVKPNYKGKVKEKVNGKPVDFSPVGSGRSGALREAKRASGIPNAEQPVSVGPSINKQGKRIPGRDYTFEGNRVIREHYGHEYPDDPSQNIGNHFNDIYGNHYLY